MFAAYFGLKTLKNNLFKLHDEKESIYLNVGFIRKSHHMPPSPFGIAVVFRRFHNNSWFYCRDTDIQSSSAPGDSVFMLFDYLSHFKRRENEK